MNKKIKITYNAPVVLTFAIISFIALIINYITNGVSNQLLFSTYRSSLLNPLTYLRLFTHVLGHADFAHFAGNMMLFFLLGPALEEKYGSPILLVMISVTAFITGIINALFFSSALLGASGIVFLFIILSSLTSFKEREIPISFIIVLVLYLGKEIVNGLLSTDNISQMAHIVGGIAGSVFGFLDKNIGHTSK